MNENSPLRLLRASIADGGVLITNPFGADSEHAGAVALRTVVSFDGDLTSTIDPRVLQCADLAAQLQAHQAHVVEVLEAHNKLVHRYVVGLGRVLGVALPATYLAVRFSTDAPILYVEDLFAGALSRAAVEVMNVVISSVAGLLVTTFLRVLVRLGLHHLSGRRRIELPPLPSL